MNAVPMIIPFSRPVTWREFVADERQDPDRIVRCCIDAGKMPPPLESILEMLIDRHEAIMTLSAEALRIALPEFVRMANDGRILWRSELSPRFPSVVLVTAGGDVWEEVAGVFNSGDASPKAVECRFPAS